MSAVIVQDKLVNLAKKFGEPEAVITEALRHYVIEQCIQRVENAKTRIEAYQLKYGSDYQTFSTRVQTDPKFLLQVESRNATWEEDAVEWRYRTEEAEEWSKMLQSILS